MSDDDKDDFGAPERWPDVPKDYQTPLNRWGYRMAWLVPAVLFLVYIARRLLSPWGHF